MKVDATAVLELLANIKGELHSVEQIVGKRIVDDRWEYLIIWKGFSIEDSSWESE